MKNAAKVLIILDGWGHNPDPSHNAIAAAKTPVWDKLWSTCPHTLLDASGREVGLPKGQMGNSEVGHLNLGAGRLVPQELVRIGQAIESGAFATNTAFAEAISAVKQQGSTLHVMGLLSPGGVHSQEEQLFELIRVAAKHGVKDLAVHAFLDGRDTAPKSASASLAKLEAVLADLGCGVIASLCGRYYAMDRDKRWERVQKAYALITEAKASHHSATAEEALQAAYTRAETDEFVEPTVIQAMPMKVNDAVIFMNFRADRARELTHALVDDVFEGFSRPNKIPFSAFVSLTHYEDNLPVTEAFPAQVPQSTLGEVVSNAGLQQLRLAETEKYAHVTFFFNGGVEVPFPAEDRVLVPSPRVATYDLQPEMSADEVTDRLVEAVAANQYSLIVCNYANADMVGHTGDFAATVKAIECLDACIGRVLCALDKTGGELLITADHGNADKMQDSNTGQPHTAHTCEPVPLVFYGREASFAAGVGTLGDVAPCLLALLGLAQPSEMTGRNLLVF